MGSRRLFPLGEVARIRWVREEGRGSSTAPASPSPNPAAPEPLGPRDETLAPVASAPARPRASVLPWPSRGLEYVTEGPPAIGPEEVVAELEAFRQRMALEGKTPYPTQERAYAALLRGNHVLLKTPQASGKTRVVEEWFAEWLRSPARLPEDHVYYTAPTKALTHEKFNVMSQRLGPAQVGLVTGDVRIHSNAPVLCCTAEVLPASVLHRSHGPRVVRVAMDEAHFFGDRERGAAWMMPLLMMQGTQFLLMSATLGDSSQLESLLRARTGRAVEVVESQRGPHPVYELYWNRPTLEAARSLISMGRAPLYVYSAIRMQANRDALALAESGACVRSPEHARSLRAALEGQHFGTSFGGLLLDCLQAGVGIHHGGMTPAMRLLVEQLFREGLLDALCGTDTLALGVNLPIRSLLLTRLDKNEGDLGRRHLTVRELKQMAGRVGRDGSGGFVVALAPRSAGQHSPRWDEQTFRRLLADAPETLSPNVSVSHDLLLGLLREKPQTALADAVRLIRNASLPKAQTRAELATLGARFRGLVRAGVVTLDPSRPGAERIALGAVPADLALHTPLSLFFYEHVQGLDVQAPDHAWRVLAAAEAVEDCGMDPSMLDRAVKQGELPEALRALGSDIPGAFALHCARDGHPGLEPAQKHLAAQILHERSSVSRFLQRHGLTSSEGEAIAYLQRLRKHLVASLPAEARTPAIEAMAERLLALTTAADNALQREWRRTGALAPSAARPIALEEVRPRLEAELAILHQLLSVADVNRAVHFLRHGHDSWTPTELGREIVGLAVLPTVGPALDEPSGLSAKPLADGVFEVTYPLQGHRGEPSGLLVGRVDLRSSPPAGESLFELDRVEAPPASGQLSANAQTEAS